MKIKNIIALLVIVSLFALVLTACKKEELPPTPPPPGGGAVAGKAMAGMAISPGELPAWAAMPVNVALTPSEANFGDGIILSVSNHDYIYVNAYIFNSVLREWQKVQFTGDRVQDWIKDSAVTSLPVTESVYQTGPNYVVVYACSKVAGKWDCHGNKWMLAEFNVKGLPMGEIPGVGMASDFIITREILPFEFQKSVIEADNFGDIRVIRYDGRYREPTTGLIGLVRVFNFNNRAELDKTIKDMFYDIVHKGWKTHMNSNLAVFLDENDHRIAVWTSGKNLIYLETHTSEYASEELINAYLSKWPSDLTKP
jgi:hypothetical protein